MDPKVDIPAVTILTHITNLAHERNEPYTNLNSKVRLTEAQLKRMKS